MDLLVDILLLLAAVVLVERSNSDRDEVWRLCLRILAAASVLAVITSERGLPISLLLLLFALWLPGADRIERLLQRSQGPGGADGQGPQP